MVKNLPAMQETQVQSLCQEDLWEEGIATHCFSSSTSSSRSNCAYSVPPSPFFLLLYPVMHAFISSFPVIETSASIYSVLWKLLHLYMYSWSIYEERWTPHPPSPPPSFLSLGSFLSDIYSIIRRAKMELHIYCSCSCWFLINLF